MNAQPRTGFKHRVFPKVLQIGNKAQPELCKALRLQAHATIFAMQQDHKKLAISHAPIKDFVYTWMYY